MESSSELLWRNFALVWGLVDLYFSCCSGSYTWKSRYRTLPICPWSDISYMYFPVPALNFHTSPHIPLSLVYRCYFWKWLMFCSAADVRLWLTPPRSPQRPKTLPKVPELGILSILPQQNKYSIPTSSGDIRSHTRLLKENFVAGVSDVCVYAGEG